MKQAVGRRALISLLLPLILLAACATQPAATPVPPAATPDQSMVTSVARIDALQAATPVSGATARALDALEGAVAACADFSEARREQVLQHVAWLRAPHSIPRDVAMALALRGSIGTALLHGMAIYASTEWRLLQRPAASCLVPIGRTLDNLLRDAGAAPLGVYDP